MDKTYLDFRLFLRHSLKLKVFNVENRKQSSLMTVVKGQFEYTYKGGSFTLNEGESVFLPFASTYSYRVVGEECLVLQIVFGIYDQNGQLSFSDHPIKSDNSSIPQVMERIVGNGVLPGSVPSFKTVSDTYKILSVFFDKNTDNRASLQIYPALKYIEEHYTEKITVEHLAKLCVLSQSQLRRVFKKETEMSPIEYKNSLRVKAACDMLLFSSDNIAEISRTLGFENPYIFSKTFKRYMNISPFKYKKSQQ